MLLRFLGVYLCAGLVLFALQVSADSLESHFAAGQQAIKSGQFEQAVAEFNDVLRISPGLVQAEVNLGLAHYLLGNYAQSTAIMAKVARQQPDQMASALFLGLGYLKLGSAGKARGPLEQVVKQDPNNAEARRALAECLLVLGNYGGASDQFRALFPLEADKGEAYFRLGRSYTECASRLVRQLSRQYRKTVWGHRMAGDLYSQTERSELGAQEYREGLAVNPRQRGLWDSLGEASLRQNKPEDAEQEFSRELELDANDETALLGMSEVKLADGNASAAIEPIQQAWKRSPRVVMAQSDFPRIELRAELKGRLITELEAQAVTPGSQFLLMALQRKAGTGSNAEAIQAELAKAAAASPAAAIGNHLAQGKQLFLERRYEAAADHFAASAQFLSDDPEALYFLARSYQMLAAECFRAEAQAAPDSWHTHVVKAEAYQLRNDNAQATSEYETALQLKPEAPEIYEALGDLFIQNNQPDRALAALEKALELEPARARTLYLLGELYINQRDEQRAILYLQKALRYDANLTEAHAYLARAYLHEGQSAEAAAEVQKALSLDIHGDLHYLLYQAYTHLGKTDLAQAALKKSVEMRKGSLERDRDKLDRWMKN